MLKALAVVTAVMVAMIGDALGGVQVIRDDLGGRIDLYQRKYDADPATLWVVDGSCASACTMVLGARHVCATRRAKFRFHSATFGGTRVKSAPGNDIMYDRYPASVQRWVDKSGALLRLKLTTMRWPEIGKHVPDCATLTTLKVAH